MNNLINKLIIIATVCFSAISVHSEVLLIDRASQENLNVPKRASSMDQVRQQFGEPEKIMSAVGQPPITQWVYSNYTVYFEHQYVINTVVHKSNSSEKGPKPIE